MLGVGDPYHVIESVPLSVGVARNNAARSVQDADFTDIRGSDLRTLTALALSDGINNG